MHTCEEERKDGDGSESEPLMADENYYPNYTTQAQQEVSEHDHKSQDLEENRKRVFPFRYETSSELERFSMFREFIQ